MMLMLTLMLMLEAAAWRGDGAGTKRIGSRFAGHGSVSITTDQLLAPSSACTTHC